MGWRAFRQKGAKARSPCLVTKVANDCEGMLHADESLNGLNEGAPVMHRGVTSGSVERVMVRFNQATNDYAMPVILELEEKLLQERLSALPPTSGPEVQITAIP